MPDSEGMMSPRKVPEVVRAVVFDLDDTLVESKVDYGKFKRLVIERIASNGEDKSRYSPTETIVSILARYEESLGQKGVPDEVIRERLAELDRIMDAVELERVSETRPIKGAAELLSLLRSKEIKIGILTRGCEEYAAQALSRAGLLDLVDAVECRSSDVKAKPDPEQYLRLVRALGVDKRETLLVGDHPIDAKCAANTDVAFIAVGTGDVSEEVMRDAGSAEYFTDVGQLAAWFEKRLYS